MLGAIQFLISSKFEHDTVKAGISGIMPGASHDDIGLILMSSIFALRPNTKRIFLHTRSTNQDAISRYKCWGFTEFAGNILHWTDLEYRTEHATMLPQTATKLHS